MVIIVMAIVLNAVTNDMLEPVLLVLLGLVALGLVLLLALGSTMPRSVAVGAV